MNLPNLRFQLPLWLRISSSLFGSRLEESGLELEQSLRVNKKIGLIKRALLNKALSPCISNSAESSGLERVLSPCISNSAELSRIIESLYIKLKRALFKTLSPCISNSAESSGIGCGKSSESLYIKLRRTFLSTIEPVSGGNPLITVRCGSLPNLGLRASGIALLLLHSCACTHSYLLGESQSGSFSTERNSSSEKFFNTILSPATTTTSALVPVSL